MESFRIIKARFKIKIKNIFTNYIEQFLKQKTLEKQAKVQFKVTNSIIENFKIESHILQRK